MAALGLDASLGQELATRFPDLRRAFDPDFMRGLLEEALVAGGPHVIEQCIPGKAYVEVDECLLRYNLRLRDTTTGREKSAVVTGRLFADPDACSPFFSERLEPLAARAEGREEIAAFRSPIAKVESMSVVVCAFPIDPDLPTLIDATDPVLMTDVLARLVPASLDADLVANRCRITVAHYPRRHRCVLRYSVTGEARGSKAPIVVFGKVSSSGEPALDRVVIDGLRRDLAGGDASIRVPRFVGNAPELDLVLIEGIPGTPGIVPMLKVRAGGIEQHDIGLDRAVEAAASVAARVHRCTARPGRPRPLESELTELRAELAFTAHVNAAVATQLEELLHEAADVATSTATLGFSHGDFTPSQILFNEAEVGLIDFDNLCYAEPELDLGQFCAYLGAAAVKAESSRGAGEDLGRRLRLRFLDAYAGVAGISNSGELRLRTEAYERVSLLRMAARAWRQLKPARAGVALEALERIATSGSEARVAGKGRPG